MGYLSSLSKPATATALDVSEWSLLVFGLILAVGALGEYKMLPGILLKIIRHRAFELMVAIGIAGEFIGDGGVFLFSRMLQTINDREFASLNKKAGDADRDAADAELQTAQLRAAMADRTLSAEQQRRIRDACNASPWKGRDVWMRSYPNDGEAARLIVEMKAAFEPCLTVEDRTGQGGIVGTLVGIRVDPSEHGRDFASFLIEALRGKSMGNLSVDDLTQFGSASETTEILVGLKPSALTQVVNRDIVSASDRVNGVQAFLTKRSLTRKEMNDLRDAFKPLADPNVWINVVWSPISEGPGIQVWQCLKDAGFEKANLVQEYSSFATGVSGAAPLSHAELLTKISSILLKARIGPWVGLLNITPEGTPVTIVVGDVRVAPLPPLKK